MLKVEDRLVIKDLKRRGMTISDIARMTGHDRHVAVASACVKVSHGGGRDSLVGPALTKALLMSPVTFTSLQAHRS